MSTEGERIMQIRARIERERELRSAKTYGWVYGLIMGWMLGVGAGVGAMVFLGEVLG